MQWLRKFEGSRLAIIGLCVAAVLFLAVNVLANTVLRGGQLDLTEGKLYTVSEGTRRLLASLQEPVRLRLYYSRNLGEAAPRYAAYHARVRELLERYAELSGGKLSLELLEPEPFSDAEDRAVADGLQGVPVSQAGDQAYFGLAGSNTVDGRSAIPFFSLEREPFLEYDLTKLVHALANPDRPVLGLMSTLANASEMGGPRGGSSLLIFDQIRDFFTVEELEPGIAAIPDKIRTLLIADLKQLSAQTLRAVDRFVHEGGRLLVFTDALTESSGLGATPSEEAPGEDVGKLLKAWGIVAAPGKVAGDIDAARRVATSERGGAVGDYVAWLTLGRQNFDMNDPIMANVDRLNIATSAILEPVEGAGVKVTPLIFTGPRAMPIDVEKVRFAPDILGLLRDYRPGDKPLMLAARISGDAARAFSEPPAGADRGTVGAGEPGQGNAEAKDGSGKAQLESSAGQPTAQVPAKEARPPEPAPLPAGERKPIEVIVVGDADMLYDRFWVQSSDFFGERVDVPTSNNADFVINALENLADAEALIGLRGRGTSFRPFTLVEALRRDAEARYRAKEQGLQERLKDLQQRLRGIERQGSEAQPPGGEVALSAEDKAAIERFRGEMLTVRKELRDVQHALRSDIESLEEKVKFINVAAVPLILGGAGGGVALFRRLRRARAKHQVGHA